MLNRLIKDQLSATSRKWAAPEAAKSPPSAHASEPREIDAITRAELVAFHDRAAARDKRFRDLVAAADQNRDTQAWAQAENLYASALQLHPYSPGYRVQYAHMLKEQGAFSAAELHYRSAYALGVPAESIAQHVAFVTERNGAVMDALSPLDLAVPAMAAPPTAVDIEILAFVLLHDRRSIGVGTAVRYIRGCRTIQDAALAIIADDRFARTNRAFLEMLEA